jgi:general secretion pathway protein B
VESPAPAVQAEMPAQPPPEDAPVMLARERRIQSLDSMVGRQIAPAPATRDGPSQQAGAARRGSVVYEGEPAPGGEQNRGGRVVYEGEPVTDEPPPAPAVAPQPAPPSASATRLPSFQDLQLRGELSLAPMHIDIHVYSDVPSERFVFINMRKYKEGEKTPEGPVVERIDPSGAVLSHQGRRFLLPRD